MALRIRTHIKYDPPKPKAPPPKRQRIATTERVVSIIKPWTPEDENTLRKMCAEGLPWKSIAEVMGRNESTVIRKAYKLNISKKSAHIPGFPGMGLLK